ncbi:MAG: PIG-L family deacetylase [Nanoarchaeota archaeon]
MKKIILAPHPDDELVGLAGMIATSENPEEFHVIYTSDGAPVVPEWYPIAGCKTPDEYRATRRAEAKAGCAYLSIPEEHLHFLEFSDFTLADNLNGLADTLTALFHVIRPTEIYIPALEKGHPDHDATHIAGWAAIKRMRNAGMAIRAYAFAEYALIDGKEAFNKFPDVNTCQVHLLTQEIIEKKKQALYLHTSQLGEKNDWMSRYFMECTREAIMPLFNYDPVQLFHHLLHVPCYFEMIYSLPISSSTIDQKLLTFATLEQKHKIDPVSTIK